MLIVNITSYIYRATCDHRILTFKQILLSPRSLSTMRNQYCSSHNNKPLEIFCKVSCFSITNQYILTLNTSYWLKEKPAISCAEGCLPNRSGFPTITNHTTDPIAGAYVLISAKYTPRSLIHCAKSQ